MSYSRFGWDDSDVYVYLDCGGYLCCCACNLNGYASDEALFPMSQREYTTAGMVAHLALHTADGQCVPEDCIEGLNADAAENDAWIVEFAAAVAAGASERPQP